MTSTFCGSRTLALDPDRTLSQYLHRTWQVQQGLPQGTLNAIRQTHDGYLWLGTQTGLMRFDGVRFAPVDAAPGSTPEKVWVRDLAEAPDHALWLATSGMGVIRVQGDQRKHYTTTEGLPSDDVYALHFDAGGTLWICTSAGLASLDPAQRLSRQAGPGAPAQPLRDACEGKDGTLWFGGDGSMLTSWNGKAFTPHPLTTVRSYAAVQSLLGAADGGIWVGTSDGLVRLRDGREERFTTANGLADNGVLSLAESRDGILWVGTKDGFSRFRDGEFESFRTKDGLSQSSVYSLCEDREGNLWVGTKYGLNQFLNRRIVPFTVNEGLAGNDSGPVLEDRAGTIWVGTIGTGLSRFDAHRFTSLTAAQGLASNSIYALADDGANGLWVGTDRGLDHLVGGKVTGHFGVAEGLPSDAVRSLCPPVDGKLWVGTGSGMALVEDGRATRPPPLTRLNTAVSALARLRDGTLMISTEDGGVYAYSDGVLRDAAPGGPLLRDVDAFHEDADGRLWLGTRGSGLLLFDRGKLSHFTTTAGLFDDDLYAVIADDQDRLWFACSKGVFSVPRAELLRFAAGEIKAVTSTPFSPTEAQRTIECKAGVQPGAWRARDGRLWFSTIRGVIVIDPAKSRYKLPAPPVLIEEVTINGKAETAGALGTLPPGVNNVEFRYTALSFQSPARMTFRYKLDGFDPGWVDAGARREAFYTNLPPGKFRFLVTAHNVDGTDTEARPVAFAISPHLYQRYWFWPMVAGILGATIWGAYRQRVRRIRENLGVIVAERSRIARELHDTLLQGFSGVTMEMQALSTRLSQTEERATLDDIIRDAGQCMREARRSVAGLRSGPGTPSGLAAALTHAARQVTEGKDLRLKLNVQPVPAPLSAEVEYNLLRIALEALANAVKHSAGRTVSISLEPRGPGLELTVRDDGVGFATDPTDGWMGHYGLTGMRERASQIGAEFHLVSEPRAGTTVRVTLPAARSAKSTAREAAVVPAPPGAAQREGGGGELE